jgi:hypothetical protein
MNRRFYITQTLIAACAFLAWSLIPDQHLALLPLFSLATTAVCNSAKVEFMQGAHCLNATLSGLAGAGASGAFTVTGLASTAGISVGMAFTATNAAAGAVVASIDSATQVTVSKAHTGIITSGTIAFTGDVLKLVLIKVSPVRTFDGTQTNAGTPGTSAASTSNIGTDEASGTGYTSGGITLTNVTPVLSSTTAVLDFNPDPSLTSATISTTAGVIQNTTARLGAAATPLSGRTISVHDFGGTQTVTAGTMTFVMPTPDNANAIVRIA